MCSSDLGPASEPSLVMWPMRNAGTWFLLAKRKTWLATSRTWLIVPGLEASFAEKTVWTESRTRTRGLSLLGLGQDPLEVGLGQEEELPVPDAEPVAAELDLLERLLARDVEDALARPAAKSRETWRRSVDLPMPGLAADQDERAEDDAAAEDLVELLDPDPESAGLRSSLMSR